MKPHRRRFLLTRGLVRLIDVSEVPYDTAGHPIVGGLFGVWHRNGKRLIFDRRPQKAIEERLGWARLPLGCQFCKLVLNPGEGIRGSGTDLKSCFFQCKNAPDAIPCNAVGISFDGEEYMEWGGIPGHKYFIAFEVLGMGDHNSVDVVQGLHVDMLTTGGATPADGCMEYGLPLPLSETYFGVYTDDVIVAQVLPNRLLAQNTGPDVSVTQRVSSIHEKYDVEVSADKGFGFFSVNPKPQTTFEAWGTRIRSEPGEVSTPVEKRKALANVVFYLVHLSHVPKSILLSVLGLLVHPFMHNRVLMACLHRTYKYLAVFYDFDIVFLPSDIKSELVLAGLCLPHVYTNIRAPLDPWVSTTDALPWAVQPLQLFHMNLFLLYIGPPRHGDL